MTRRGPHAHWLCCCRRPLRFATPSVGSRIARCTHALLSAGTPKAFQLLNDPDAAAGGDYKFDPLGFGGGKMMEEKELANGRIAMLAFSGIVTQATLTGNGFPYTYNGVADLVPPLSMQSMPGFY
jgi:hypothetical protein